MRRVARTDRPLAALHNFKLGYIGRSCLTVLRIPVSVAVGFGRSRLRSGQDRHISGPLRRIPARGAARAERERVGSARTPFRNLNMITVKKLSARRTVIDFSREVEHPGTR